MIMKDLIYVKLHVIKIEIEKKKEISQAINRHKKGHNESSAAWF